MYDNRDCSFCKHALARDASAYARLLGSITTYSALILLSFEICRGCSAVICSSVYCNNRCRLKSAVLGASAALAGGLVSSRNYSSVIALRLDIGPMCSGRVASAIYCNRRCGFNGIRISAGVSNSSACRCAFVSGTNYSSAMALHLCMEPLGDGSFARIVYRNSVCRFRNGFCARDKACSAACVSEGNYSSVIALRLAIGSTSQSAICSSVYRKGSCLFKNGCVSPNACDSALNVGTGNYSSVEALMLARGPICGVRMDASVYRNSLPCRFKARALAGKKRCARAFGSGYYNYSSAIGLALAMCAPRPAVSGIAVYTGNSCSFCKRGCAGSNSCGRRVSSNGKYRTFRVLGLAILRRVAAGVSAAVGCNRACLFGKRALSTTKRRRHARIRGTTGNYSSAIILSLAVRVISSAAVCTTVYPGDRCVCGKMGCRGRNVCISAIRAMGKSSIITVRLS